MADHVFISYGRRDAASFVAALQPLLATNGVAVFVDRTGLRPGAAWDEGLADAIDTAAAVIAVLSPHAVRRANDPANEDGTDSVCLDEIVRARNAGRRVLPVMIESCEVPLPIARLNYIDMVGWQASAAVRQQGFGAIMAALQGGAQITSPAFAAWDSAGLLAVRAQGFSGRGWLFAQVEEWVGAGEEKALLLLGPPGIGKSAFAAELIRRDGGRQVAAYHIFQSDTPATRDSGRFVRGLAAQLARTVPGYGAAIRAPETSRLLDPGESDSDPASALDGAIMAPLASLAPPAGQRLVVLDALDEAGGPGADRQGRSIIGLLASRLERWPPWLKLLATARLDPAALRGFEAARHLRLDQRQEQNRTDVEEWLTARMAGPAAGQLTAAANGSFLYARMAAEAAERAGSDFEPGSLPPRLSGLFSQFFGRSFPTTAAYGPARRVLSIMLAAREPLPEAAVGVIAGLGLPAARATFDALAPYLDRGGAGLTLHHKALADWLTDAREGDPAYLVDPAEGGLLVLRWCETWETAPDAYKMRHLAAHLADAGQAAALRTLLDAGQFHAARTEDAHALAADWGTLAGALLAVGDDAGVAGLTITADAVRRDAVVAAIMDAALPRLRLLRVVAAMRGRDPAGRAARLAGIRLAARAGVPGPLLEAARDGDRALAAAVVPAAYRMWREFPEIGWAAFADILGTIPNWAGLPRGGAVEVAAGLSFAIVTHDAGDPSTFQRLGVAWRDAILGLQGGLAARVLGRWWVRTPLEPLLRALMSRQPDYQPFNYAEITTAFSRPPAAHAPALEVVACLEDPRRGPGPVVDVLTRPGLLFDVHLMLAAERTLVRLGAEAPAPVLEALDTLMRHGPAWFRQSVLYIGFHVLSAASEPHESWFARYSSWADATIGPERATLRTDTRTYQLVPHMAWPEVVYHRHGRPMERGFIAGWLEQAAALGDLDFARRGIGAAVVLSFAYRLDALALDALEATLLRRDPALQDDLLRALADIRFNAGALVDRFLVRIGREDVLGRVSTTPTTLSLHDFPTWIDAFFNQLLVGNDAFRGEVVEIFRRTAAAASPRELIGMLVGWVIQLLERGPGRPSGTRTSGAAPAAASHAETRR